MSEPNNSDILFLREKMSAESLIVAMNNVQWTVEEEFVCVGSKEDGSSSDSSYFQDFFPVVTDESSDSDAEFDINLKKRSALNNSLKPKQVSVNKDSRPLSANQSTGSWALSRQRSIRNSSVFGNQDWEHNLL